MHCGRRSRDRGIDVDRRHALARGHTEICAAITGLILVGASALGLPGSAHRQASAFTFYGRGFGHGVGMSQYGAQGAAAAGWSAPRILGWFYRGTRLTVMPSPIVRVLLSDTQARTTIASVGGARVVDARSGRLIGALPGGGVAVSTSGSRSVLRAASGARLSGASPALRFVPEPGGLVVWSGHR